MLNQKSELSIFGLRGIPEITPGDDLPKLIMEAAKKNKITIEEGDIFVVTQKIVSKAEGCIYQKEEMEASSFAKQMGQFTGHSPEYMELVLRESKRIVRMGGGVLISQTHHGFVMANAGVDCSNAGRKDRMIVLPPDPDGSALKIKESIERLTGKRIAVVISDTFGRPWRNGQVNQAIGVAGFTPLIDYRGQKDDDGRELKVTQIAVADELASAAELVSGKAKRIPVVIIRGYQYLPGSGTVKELIMEEEKDLFK